MKIFKLFLEKCRYSWIKKEFEELNSLEKLDNKQKDEKEILNRHEEFKFIWWCMGERN